jgi:3-hydroxyacyl-CoA dehydrogenase/enoyl-CoA hydratase/3-hydroxybutyryl-CoA epimerase
MGAFALDTDGRVGVVTFNLPNAPVNMLSAEVGAELGEVLDRCTADAGIDAVVLRSGKPSGFIAGADVHALARLESREAARDLSRTGQRMMDHLASLAKPVVVAIHGACLGGGLELALAAHYRVATSAGATTLGLPEVRLGLLPGAGGTQRLPRLVGLRRALDLMLTGRTLPADRALRAGLVDEVVPPAILDRVAHETAVRLASGWRPPRRRRDRLASAAPVRWLVLALAARRVRATTGGHYPAPPAILDAVGHGLARGQAAGLAREADWFGQLAVSPESRRLVALFFATTALGKDTGVDGDVGDAIPEVERIGVVGAGFMGAAVAGVAALRAGVTVRLRDADAARVATGLRNARRVLDSARRRRRLDPFEHTRRTALLSGTTGTAGFTSREFVIEAVFEDLAVKREVLAGLEAATTPDTVLASNTSTLPIARLQEGTRHPERILGMHFFSPVERMPLVEVIRGAATGDRATAATVRLGQRMGKTVIVVGDSPGFWINRILAPYLNEAGWLLAEGVGLETIDRALVAFGFPVGPVTLLDEVGLDVAGKAAAVLHEAFGERMAPAPAVARLIEAGRLGRKSGAGFYRYPANGRRRTDPAVASLLRAPGAAGAHANGDADGDALVRRPLLMLLNEAALAHAEGVVRSARDGDVGAVLGFGFPPFLGGPLRYIDDQGAGAVVAELQSWAGRVGQRFAPCDALMDMARAGRAFHA